MSFCHEDIDRLYQVLIDDINARTKFIDLENSKTTSFVIFSDKKLDGILYDATILSPASISMAQSHPPNFIKTLNNKLESNNIHVHLNYLTRDNYLFGRPFRLNYTLYRNSQLEGSVCKEYDNIASYCSLDHTRVYTKPVGPLC